MMNLVFESINPIEIPQWMINWAHNQQKFSVFVFYTVELYWIESDSESFPCGITKQWGNGTDSMSSNNKSLMCRRAFFDQQWNSKLVSAQYLLQIAIPHMSVCFSACDWQPLNKKNCRQTPIFHSILYTSHTANINTKMWRYLKYDMCVVYRWPIIFSFWLKYYRYYLSYWCSTSGDMAIGREINRMGEAMAWWLYAR